MVQWFYLQYIFKVLSDKEEQIRTSNFGRIVMKGIKEISMEVGRKFGTKYLILIYDTHSNLSN